MAVQFAQMPIFPVFDVDGCNIVRVRTLVVRTEMSYRAQQSFMII